MQTGICFICGTHKNKSAISAKEIFGNSIVSYILHAQNVKRKWKWNNTIMRIIVQ